MTSAATVGPDTIVSIHYTLTAHDSDLFDSSQGGEPLTYLHGADNIVPGLEQALHGLAVGDHVEVEVSPEEGYGVRREQATQQVERSAFPDDLVLKVGMQFGLEGPGGEPIPVWVKEVADDHVVLDFNHPLAGMTLHFDVTIAEIRNATPAELNDGRPQSACCSDANCKGNA